nr:hypothetical protein [uncultured Desulfuromonas sp.]
MKQKELQDYLISKGFEKRGVLSFLRLFDFPSGELGLGLIQHHLPAIMQSIAAIAYHYPGNKIKQEYNSLAQIIADLELPGHVDENRTSKLPPHWGDYEKHPVFIAILHCPAGKGQEPYLSLLSHIILASERIRTKVIDNPEYRNVLVTAPTCLRKMAQPPYLGVLSTVKTRCSSLQLSKNIQDSVLVEELQPIRTLLGYVAGKSAPSRTGIKGYTTQQTKPELSLLPDQRDATNTDTPQIALIEQKLASRDQEETMLATHEISHAPDLIMLTEAEATNNLQTKVQGALRSQRAARTALSKHNQCLPYSWEQLSLFEVRELYKEICCLDFSDPICARILLLMLTTGQTLGTILNFEVYKAEALPANPKIGLWHHKGRWSWINRPSTANVARPEACLQVIQTAEYLCLDLPAVMQDMLNSHATVSFEEDYGDLPERIQNHLTRINASNQIRLTTGRISHYLGAAIQHEIGADITTAMYITGQPDYLGTVVGHYSGQKVRLLQEVYTNFWRKTLQYTHDYESDTPQEGLVGSTRIPQLRALQNLIPQLYERVASRYHALQQTQSIEKIIRYHNAYTSFVAMMVAYATGVRAVTSPMPHYSEIDMETGFYVLRDKDSTDGYHTRLMWLPPICVAQLCLYWDHAKKMVNQLSVLQSDFFTHVKTKRTRKIENEIFYLTMAGEPKEITPSTLHDFSDLPCPVFLPGNAHRHFLRSALLARNCPSEIINAFMGHWFLGEEPWGRYSGLSPVVYRQTLSEHIPALLEQLGFQIFDQNDLTNK